MTINGKQTICKKSQRIIVMSSIIRRNKHVKIGELSKPITNESDIPERTRIKTKKRKASKRTRMSELEGIKKKWGKSRFPVVTRIPLEMSVKDFGT